MALIEAAHCEFTMLRIDWNGTKPYQTGVVFMNRSNSVTWVKYVTVALNIKPSCYKICWKFSAFTGYFTFKGPASAQVLASSGKTLWNLYVYICTVLLFFHAFQVECWRQSHLVIFWCMFFALNVFCMGKSAQHLDGEYNFPIVGHEMQRTLKVIFCAPENLIFLHANRFQSALHIKGCIFPIVLHRCFGKNFKYHKLLL